MKASLVQKNPNIPHQSSSATLKSQTPCLSIPRFLSIIGLGVIGSLAVVEGCRLLNGAVKIEVLSDLFQNYIPSQSTNVSLGIAILVATIGSKVMEIGAKEKAPVVKKESRNELDAQSSDKIEANKRIATAVLGELGLGPNRDNRESLADVLMKNLQDDPKLKVIKAKQIGLSAFQKALSQFVSYILRSKRLDSIDLAKEAQKIASEIMHNKFRELESIQDIETTQKAVVEFLSAVEKALESESRVVLYEAAKKTLLETIASIK